MRWVIGANLTTVMWVNVEWMRMKSYAHNALVVITQRQHLISPPWNGRIDDRDEMSIDLICRQRRWWNAYILFYERLSDQPTEPTEQLNQSLSEVSLCKSKIESSTARTADILDDANQRMPLLVQRSVRKQNIKFLHNRIHLSPEYFAFMKTLVQNNVQYLKKIPGTTPANMEVRLFHQSFPSFLSLPSSVDLVNWRNGFDDHANHCQIHLLYRMASEETASVRLAVSDPSIDPQLIHRFICRGPAGDWGEVVAQCMRVSSKARRYLADELLVRHPNRFQEYFLDCTFVEVIRMINGNFRIGASLLCRFAPPLLVCWSISLFCRVRTTDHRSKMRFWTMFYV